MEGSFYRIMDSYFIKAYQNSFEKLSKPFYCGRVTTYSTAIP